MVPLRYKDFLGSARLLLFPGVKRSAFFSTPNVQILAGPSKITFFKPVCLTPTSFWSVSLDTALEIGTRYMYCFTKSKQTTTSATANCHLRTLWVTFSTLNMASSSTDSSTSAQATQKFAWTLLLQCTSVGAIASQVKVIAISWSIKCTHCEYPCTADTPEM